MSKLYVAKNGLWKSVKDAYISLSGQWEQQKIRLVGINGKWVETLNNERVPPNEFLDVFGLSFRSGSPLQGGLDIKGFGLTDVVTPEPRTGAFYSLRGSIGDYFDNFDKLVVEGDEIPLPTLEDGAMAYALDSSKRQYLRTNINETSMDLRGLMGGDANAIYEPRGVKHWELGGKFKAKSWPLDSNPRYLYFSGTPTQNLAVWFDKSGTIFARFQNGGYIKNLAISNAVSLNAWVGFVFRHRPSGNTRHLELEIHTGEKVSVSADRARYVSGVLYYEFLYWNAPEGMPINIAAGELDAGFSEALKFFLPENTPDQYAINSSGDELLGTGTQYKTAYPSGLMPPNTGKYFAEILNRDSYDIHIGFTDEDSNLGVAPATIGWCLNSINGRKFLKQVGGGTSWGQAIPPHSIIGLLYDSDLGEMELFVNGVSRGKPFDPGIIQGSVRFIIGGRAQNATTRLFNIKVVLSPSLWAYPPSGNYSPYPKSQAPVPGGWGYTTGVFKDYYMRNTPMSPGRTLAVSDPNLKFEVVFKNVESSVETVVNEYILKSTGGLVILSIPELPYGNYKVICRYRGYADSTPRLFTIRPPAFRTTPLHVDFATSTVEHIRKELMPAHKQWGGLNGGVVADNIILDRKNGLCEISCQGNLYRGQIKGVDRFGEPSGFNQRIGGCIVTRDYYGPASYRILVKPAPLEGVCNAFWSFHYEEGYPGSPLFNRHLADGLHMSGNEVDGYYTVRNHEIDIEFPTALKTTPNQENVNFHSARLNTWLGENRNWYVPNNDVPTSDPGYSPDNDPEYWSEYTDNFVDLGVNLADGEYHELRYDWHLGSDPRVEFYIDGVFTHVIRTHIPDIPGRYWAGLWFPSAATHWAGRNADWVFQKMYIKSLDIIPFESEQGYTRNITETYPNDVFRDFRSVRYE